MSEQTLIFPDDFTEKQKQDFTETMKYHQKRDFGIRVVYKPSCGCDVVGDYLLDRHPMSKKIHGHCPKCNKGVLFEITDPMRLYDPLSEEEVTIDEMMEAFITPGHFQEEFLKAIRDKTEQVD